jgi:hypothetical protein
MMGQSQTWHRSQPNEALPKDVPSLFVSFGGSAVSVKEARGNFAALQDCFTSLMMTFSLIKVAAA